MLLTARANKDLIAKDGGTALASMSVLGDFQVVRMLLKAGAFKAVADRCATTAALSVLRQRVIQLYII